MSASFVTRWQAIEGATQVVIWPTPTPGSWYDTVDLAGDYIDEPAPASSFYHMVAAITELSGTLSRIASTPPVQ